MPHDRSGKVMKAGDTVTVPCVVKSVSAGEEYCNVTLETVEPMFPGPHKSGVTLNAKQVELVKSASDDLLPPDAAKAT